MATAKQAQTGKKPAGATAPRARTRRGPGQNLQQLLRADIVSGRIAAGARLKVADIIARYDTSTNPAREALHALEGEGLVVLTPNRGARVRSIDDRFVDSMFDIRRLIEPYIVSWFAEYATTEDRLQLRDIQERCHAASEAGDIEGFHKFNREFHDFIISRHFNTEAARIMRMQNTWLRLLTSGFPPSPPQMKQSSAEHWELLAAMDEFDGERAGEIIIRHSERSQTAMMARMRAARQQG